MKKILLFLFIVLPFVSFSQCLTGDYPNHFDIPGYNYACQFYRDTTDTINVWQVGIPQKSILDTAHSGARVIITDSVESYSINDTSTFLITHIVGSATLYWHLTSISGYYFVYSDTLTDYGLIEFSPDNGRTWVDLVHDTTGLANWSYSATLKKPILSGNSFGWKYFRCLLDFSSSPYTFDWGDTVKYRFSFITDTIDTHKDGLMFDDIVIFDVAEDVPAINGANQRISVYPNPATGKIHIQSPSNTSHKTLRILNYTGTLIKEITNYTGTEIDISYLPLGMYVLKYADEQWNDAVPFQVRH